MTSLLKYHGLPYFSNIIAGLIIAVFIHKQLLYQILDEKLSSGGCRSSLAPVLEDRMGYDRVGNSCYNDAGELSLKPLIM